MARLQGGGSRRSYGTTANSQVTAVTTYNGSLLFGATVNGLVRLHRSNGTPAGTTSIANFRSITQPTLANGSLYFVARTIASGDELWKLTGAGSPVMVKDINPNGASNPSQLTKCQWQVVLYRGRWCSRSRNVGEQRYRKPVLSGSRCQSWIGQFRSHKFWETKRHCLLCGHRSRHYRPRAVENQWLVLRCAIGAGLE